MGSSVLVFPFFFWCACSSVVSCIIVLVLGRGVGLDGHGFIMSVYNDYVDSCFMYQRPRSCFCVCQWTVLDRDIFYFYFFQQHHD